MLISSLTKRLAAFAVLLAAVPVAAEPAMWRIHDADTEIILFGSMHELPKGTKWLSPRIAAQVDSADTLVLEAVILDDLGVMSQLTSRLGYSPKLPKLDTRISPARRTKLDAAVAATAVSIDSLNLMETWLASIVLADATLQRIGLDAASGVEAILTARVRAAGRPIVPLESVEQQLGYFDTLPETDQRILLDATVDDVASADADTRHLVAAWLTGDVPAIAAAYAHDAFGATPRIARVLLTERNARWADWIRARLATPGKVFIAVGAAHLAGPQSVQTMLAARGVTAERLP